MHENINVHFYTGGLFYFIYTLDWRKFRLLEKHYDSVIKDTITHTTQQTVLLQILQFLLIRNNQRVGFDFT